MSGETILQALPKMLGSNPVRTRQIGDGAADPQNPVVPAGAQTEALGRRLEQVDEVEVKTQMITNLLADVRVNLETLGEQKSLVDHLSEKLARLDFMTQEAQKTLQRERELAERIEQGIRQLRSRSLPGGTGESKTA